MPKKRKKKRESHIEWWTRIQSESSLQRTRLREEAEQRLEKITKKKNPTLEEIKDVLFNLAFGMLYSTGNMEDLDAEVLGNYLDKVSERTIRGNYRRYLSKEGLNLEGIYRVAKRLR